MRISDHLVVQDADGLLVLADDTSGVELTWPIRDHNDIHALADYLDARAVEGSLSHMRRLEQLAGPDDDGVYTGPVDDQWVNLTLIEFARFCFAAGHLVGGRSIWIGPASRPTAGGYRPGPCQHFSTRGGGDVCRTCGHTDINHAPIGASVPDAVPAGTMISAPLIPQEYDGDFVQERPIDVSATVDAAPDLMGPLKASLCRGFIPGVGIENLHSCAVCGERWADHSERAR